jgi:hypothetical protein
VGEADSTAEAAEQRFTGEGVLVAEAALRTSVGAPPTADIMAATMGGAATTAGAAIMEAGVTTDAAVTAGATGGAAGIGAEDMVMGGAGELALGGRIGDGAIRMPPITVPGITGLTLIILIRTTALQTILGDRRILTAATTILPQQIPTHGRSPTRADRQEPGDHQYLEGHLTRATQTATVLRVGRFCPLTR